MPLLPYGKTKSRDKIVLILFHRTKENRLLLSETIANIWKIWTKYRPTKQSALSVIVKVVCPKRNVSVREQRWIIIFPSPFTHHFSSWKTPWGRPCSTRWYIFEQFAPSHSYSFFFWSIYHNTFTFPYLFHPRAQLWFKVLHTSIIFHLAGKRPFLQHQIVKWMPAQSIYIFSNQGPRIKTWFWVLWSKEVTSFPRRILRTGYF